MSEEVFIPVSYTHLLVGKIEKIIEKRGGSILESYKLFDIYEGAQIKEEMCIRDRVCTIIWVLHLQECSDIMRLHTAL